MSDIPEMSVLSLTDNQGNMNRFAPTFDYVRNLVHTDQLPSSVFGVTDAGGHTEIQSFGTWPTGQAVQNTDPYLLFSVTKPVVGLAFMQLVERGLVNLQHEVKQYLPDFGTGRADKVLVWHLLTHTSGMSEPALTEANGGALRDQLPHTGANFLAGSFKQYSNMAFAASQAILERVTGLSLEDYLQQNLFGPLGMTSTSFNTYERNPAGFLPMQGIEKVGLNYDGFLQLKHPAAGLFSSAPDLLKLGQCLLNDGVHEHEGGRGQGHILGKTTLREMIRPQTAGIPAIVPNEWPDDCEFGLTFIRPVRTQSIVHKNIYGHNGWGGCKFWMYPEEGVAFVLMTNLMDPSLHGVDLDMVHNVFSASL